MNLQFPITQELLTAGHCILTVSNDKGNHYTYLVEKGDEHPQFGVNWFVKLLTGPDNRSDYTYMGMLPKMHGQPECGLRLTKKSRYNDESNPVKVFRWAVANIWIGKPFPKGYACHGEGRCARCGRPLTTPESCKRGLGPVCLGKD